MNLTALAHFKTTMVLCVIAALSACGGGGGGDTATSPTTNNGVDTTAPTAKAWGMATLIETDNAGDAFSSQVAFDASGNALAVWTQFNGTRNNISANRFTAATSSWGSAALIETDNAGGAGSPQLAYDASGNALAVWTQSDGTRNNIWANRFSAATSSWGTAALIETDNAGGAFYPQIAVDASGNALAVWQQYDGARDNIYANRFTAATNSWGIAGLIETDLGNAFDPQIAIDASGNALAVWSQFDGTRHNIYANRFAAATSSWGTSALIETNNAGSASRPQIAVNASGDALAVWHQFDGTRINIWANRFTAATSSWGTAALIETDNFGDALSPQIAFDASGNALAVWRQFDGTRTNIWANRFTAAAGSWGTAALIETDNFGDAFSPQIAFDAGGNALAVWEQSDGTRSNIWANRFTAATTSWGTAALIETDNAGNASNPQVAFDASGNALAVWEQSDGTRSSIWTNSFR